ncbi:hypothetical protein QJS10_CPB13g00604 [Acorus calamus]|uniref:Uncharacterized protein n=1 Tax=Acorus calamus TaxID=4465 RepID=A0AAV9DF49_ACOCL|nr:hypothetical protein QJS10_CPB13g00604 [Acorus calamus]
MPATDFQGSSVPFSSLGRSILSIRRERVHSMDANHEASSGGASSEQDQLESFQKHVADLFLGLAASSPDDLLSLSWIRKLLDAFLICQEEFRAVLFSSRAGLLSRPPLDRLIGEFYERSVKALDVCNAVRDGIEQVRSWQRHLDIVVSALDGGGGRVPGEGQLRRAKKALAELTIGMLDEKDSATVLAHRNRSFGRNNGGGGSTKDHHRPSHFRSLSWSVSRSWSAAKQLQAIGNNLTAPRGHEVDRGLQIHFSVPRQFLWAVPVMSLHERIVEESKRRDRKNSNGL